MMVGLLIVPGSAKTTSPEQAAIDVASSATVLVRGGPTPETLQFSVACGHPASATACDASETLFTRSPGGDWSAVTGSRASGEATFVIPVPGSGYLEYYLQVTDQATSTTATFPSNGSSDPLRIYALPFVRPHALEALPFDQHRRPDSVLDLPWGSDPGDAGLVVGEAGRPVGPQAVDVDASGNIYLLDQVNQRVQIFERTGRLRDVIPFHVGPLGDLALGGDGSFYVLDSLPEDPGSSPVVRHVVPADAARYAPAAVASTPAPEPGATLLRMAEGTLWSYGVPSDAWRPVMGDTEGLPAIQMGMPTEKGELLRRVRDLRQIDVAPLGGANQSGFTLTAPGGWYFGELSLVEPDRSDGYWIVVRTWREHPQLAEHHDVIHVSSTGEILAHFAVADGEYAETASLSEFRLGQDGRLYQIWNDQAGLQVRGFDLSNGGQS
jgi:hypothetical protein